MEDYVIQIAFLQQGTIQPAAGNKLYDTDIFFNRMNNSTEPAVSGVLDAPLEDHDFQVRTLPESK
jgi:hypothetical protein